MGKASESERGETPARTAVSDRRGAEWKIRGGYGEGVRG